MLDLRFRLVFEHDIDYDEPEIKQLSISYYFCFLFLCYKMVFCYYLHIKDEVATSTEFLP